MIDRMALGVTVAAFLVGVGVDVLIGDEHYFPGYAASIGLFGCIALVIVSKALGAYLVQRPEDHYPLDTPADRQEDLRG